MTRGTDLPPTLLDNEKRALDHERFALEQRRLVLDESWPRKWGTIAVSVAVPLSVALVGLFSNLYAVEQSKLQEAVADRERKKADEIAEDHKITEENRAALELYLKYMSGKDQDEEAYASQLQAISSLSHDLQFRQTLLSQKIALLQKEPGKGASQNMAPSVVLAGAASVNLKGAPVREADFTIYIQYFEPRGDGLVTVLCRSLESLRLVQGDRRDDQA